MRRFIIMLLFVLAGNSAESLRAQQQGVAEQQKTPDVKATASKTVAVLPTVDQILEKYVKAIGGRAAAEKVTSRMMKGTFAMPAMSLNGTHEGYQKAPNKMASTVNLPGFGVIREGFDGKTAWAQDPVNGLREKTGEELAMTRLLSEFYRDLRLKELYAKMEVQGKEKVGEKEAYVIIASNPGTSPEKMYFDVETGLLLRSDMEIASPQAKMPVQFFYEDYRPVDGVMIPFTIRQVTPVFNALITISEVRHNIPIDEEKFAKPAAQ